MSSKRKHGAPTKMLVGAEMFRLVVLKVEGRTVLGAPKECRLIGDAETIHVEDGDEFITAYVPARVLRETN